MWFASEKVWKQALAIQGHGEKEEGWSLFLYIAKVKKAEPLENSPKTNKNFTWKND